MEDDFVDAYALLGIARDCSDVSIKAAYRVRARDVHPDKNPSPHAAALFNAIKNASEVLLDSTSRAALDRRLDARAQEISRRGALDEARARLREELEAREKAGAGMFGVAHGGFNSKTSDIERLRRDGQHRRTAYAELVGLEQSAVAAAAVEGLNRQQRGLQKHDTAASLTPNLDLALTVRVNWSVKEFSGGGPCDETLKATFSLCGEVAFVLSRRATGAVLVFTCREAAAAALAAPPDGFRVYRIGGAPHERMGDEGERAGKRARGGDGVGESMLTPLSFQEYEARVLSKVRLLVAEAEGAM